MISSIASGGVAQLIVRRIEAAVVRRLRQRAAAEGVSTEEAHRRVLREALLGAQPPAGHSFIDYLRALPDVELPLSRADDRPRPVALR